MEIYSFRHNDSLYVTWNWHILAFYWEKVA